jgi:hypothetical protein
MEDRVGVIEHAVELLLVEQLAFLQHGGGHLLDEELRELSAHHLLAGRQVEVVLLLRLLTPLHVLYCSSVALSGSGFARIVCR